MQTQNWRMINLDDCLVFIFVAHTGTLLSQKSLMQIADELQYKSRVIAERYMTKTLRPALDKIYAVILSWLDAVARYIGLKKVNASRRVLSPSPPLSLAVLPANGIAIAFFF